MKKVLILGLIVVFLAGLVLAIDNQTENNKSSGFCGTSGLGFCNTDSDCVKAGCSGQVCQNSNLANDTITTCEYRTCYNDSKQSCLCKDNKCQWKEKEDNNNNKNDDDNETDNETDGCEWQCTKWTDCLNQTQTRTCINTNNCTGETPKQSKTCEAKEDKSCCKITKTEDNKTEIEYDYENTKECVSKKNTTKEIVNSSFCKEDTKERKRIHFEDKTGINCTEGCNCRGVVMTCTIEGGTQMTVFTESGNIIIQIRGTNVTTNVTLYKETNGTLVGKFKDEEREIKVLPDQAEERIREKIKTNLEDENITLNDQGFYVIEGKKQSRLFFIFPVSEKVNAEVNSEDGQVVKIRNPWWGFLARDKKD